MQYSFSLNCFTIPTIQVDKFWHWIQCRRVARSTCPKTSWRMKELIFPIEIKTQRGGGKKGETLWRDDRLFGDKEPVDSDPRFCSSFSIEWGNLRARSNSIYLPNAHGISIMWGYGRSGPLFDFVQIIYEGSPGRKKGTGKWISFALASGEIR